MEATEHQKGPAGDLSRDQDQAEPGAEEATEQSAEEKSAEELEEEAGESGGSDSAEVSRVTDVLDREAEPLRQGEALDTPLGPLPRRSLAAIAIFVVVSVCLYLVLWALLGTLGLLLGWIPAAGLGLLAAREWGRRQEAA
jgi:hypothetical protein